MGKPVVESRSSMESSEMILPITQSLLGGIKRVFGFFVMSEDEMAQAGIYLGNSQMNSSPENHINLPGENSEYGRRVS